MKRMTIVSAALACVMLMGGDALVVGQVNDPNDHVPGGMSQARMLVLNRGENESIPVTIQGAVGTPMRVQVASAVDARAARQVWEYRQISFPLSADMAAALNAAGADGWEVTGVAAAGSSTNTVLLKRPRNDVR